MFLTAAVLFYGGLPGKVVTLSRGGGTHFPPLGLFIRVIFLGVVMSLFLFCFLSSMYYLVFCDNRVCGCLAVDPLLQSIYA